MGQARDRLGGWAVPKPQVSGDVVPHVPLALSARRRAGGALIWRVSGARRDPTLPPSVGTVHPARPAPHTARVCPAEGYLSVQTAQCTAADTAVPPSPRLFSASSGAAGGVDARALCNGPPKPHAQELLRWMHIPKTGSTFLKVGRWVSGWSDRHRVHCLEGGR